MACNRGLSEEDHQHILSCRSCSDVAAKVAELDFLVRQAMDRDVPSDFADRIVARISADELRNEDLSSRPLPLLERIFYSSAVQWLLVGLGSVFGLLKIFKFFSALLVRVFV